MSIAHMLEDFGDLMQGGTADASDLTLEEARLEAFEKGYQAGWDDSASAQAEDARRISADFAQNLQDLSFTYHEAYTAVLSSLEPLLRQMTDTVLPSLAQETLGQQVVELLDGMASHHGPAGFEIVTAPENVQALESLAETMPQHELSIVADETLGSGQVQVRLGRAEREIDTETVLTAIRHAVSEFLDDQLKETA
ncbi:MAG: flagellar biosynthesis protein [Roseovarius sp.]|nr:flagellar biosynthesis protein [Roseovarius sp.]